MKERHDKSCLVSARQGTSHHLSLSPVTRLCRLWLSLTFWGLGWILCAPVFEWHNPCRRNHAGCWNEKKTTLLLSTRLPQQCQHPSNYLLHFVAATDPGTLCQFNYQVSRSWPLPDNSPHTAVRCHGQQGTRHDRRISLFVALLCWLLLHL